MNQFRFIRTEIDLLVVDGLAALLDHDLVGSRGEVDHIVRGVLEIALPVEIILLHGLDVVLILVDRHVDGIGTAGDTDDDGVLLFSVHDGVQDRETTGSHQPDNDGQQERQYFFHRKRC